MEKTMNTSPTRRHVLGAMTAGATTAVIGAGAEPAAKENTMSPEFYELRAMRLRRGPMSKRLDEYLKDALIPGARRAGCGPIGAFNVSIGVGNPTTWLLIPHPTIESF